MSSEPIRQRCKDTTSHDKVLQIAADQNAPGEILASLAEHVDSEVRAKVAANPNTPQSVLKWLWIEFPHSLMSTRTQCRKNSA
jgi:hypothetical protein